MLIERPRDAFAMEAPCDNITVEIVAEATSKLERSAGQSPNFAAAYGAQVVDATTGEIIPHELAGITVGQRRTDGYFNATAMCQAAGKKFNHYSDRLENKALVAELASITGIPAIQLVQSRVGGNIPDGQRGTWIHPDIAINLAQWCSAKFAVQVSRWTRELLTTGQVSLTKPAFNLPQTYEEALEAHLLAVKANSRLMLQNEEIRESLVTEIAIRAVAEKEAAEAYARDAESIRSIDEFLAIVDEDEHGCFWG